MSEVVSRRDFLFKAGKYAAAAATLGSIASVGEKFSLHNPFETRGSPPEPLTLWEQEPSYDTLIPLCLNLYSLVGQVRPKTTPINSQQDVTQFTRDIAPYFLSTGIYNDPIKFSIPKITITDYWKAGLLDAYSGALADSQCLDSGHIRINQRMFSGYDKFDAWNNGKDRINTGEIAAAIAHEIVEAEAVHYGNSNEFCNDPYQGQYDLVADQDTYAQVASVTALSAMFMDSIGGIDRGNPDALAGILYQFRRFATGALLMKTMADNNWKPIRDYARQLPNSTDNLLHIDELEKQFKQDGFSLADGVDIYDNQPWQLLRKAFITNKTPGNLSLRNGQFDLSQIKAIAGNLNELVAEL